MKKIAMMLIALAAIVSISFASFAHEHDGITHEHEVTIIDQFEKEITVEVSSEEEFLNYPKNPNYKYTFLFPVDERTKAICYNCGLPYLGLGTVREQSTTVTVGCPTNQLSPDIFMTWNNWHAERCTACGMQNRISQLEDTYSSRCYDTGQEWEVKKSYTLAGGYEIHQVYDYWIDPSGFRP